MDKTRTEKELARAIARMEADALYRAQRLAAIDPDIREALYNTWQTAFRRGHLRAAPDAIVGLEDNPFSGPAIDDWRRARRHLRAPSD